MGKQANTEPKPLEQNVYDDKLNSAIDKLIDKGTSDDDIKFFIEDFKTLYSVKKKDESNSTSEITNSESNGATENTSLATQEPKTNFTDRYVQDLETQNKAVNQLNNVTERVREWDNVYNVNDDERALAKQRAEERLSEDVSGLETAGYYFSSVMSYVTSGGLVGKPNKPVSYRDTLEKEAIKALKKEGQNATPEALELKINDIAVNKELSSLKKQKVKTYLEELPEEDKEALRIDKVMNYKSLEEDEQLKVAELEMLRSKMDVLESKIASNESAMDNLSEGNEAIPEQLQQLRKEKIDTFNSLVGKYNTLRDDLVANESKQLEEKEAIDLIKREYGWKENLKSTLGISVGSAIDNTISSGAYLLNAKAIITGNPLDKLASEELTEKSKDLRKDTKEVQKLYAEPMAYDEINGLGDLGYFVAQEITNQYVTLLEMSNPVSATAGITMLGLQSAGDKYMTMKEEESNSLNPKSYSPAQEIIAPALYGGAESLLGSLPTLGILKRTVNAPLTKTLFKEGNKKYGKQFLKDNGIEVLTETGTTYVQNGVDIYGLGDTSKTLIDNIDHTGISTLASSPFITGGTKLATETVSYFTPKSGVDGLSKNIKKLKELEQDYTSAESAEAKTVIQDQIETVLKDNKRIYDGAVSTMKNVDEKSYNAIQSIISEQASLRNKAIAIRDDKGLSKSSKENALKPLKKRFNDLETERNDVLEGKAFSTDDNAKNTDVNEEVVDVDTTKDAEDVKAKNEEVVTNEDATIEDNTTEEQPINQDTDATQNLEEDTKEQEKQDVLPKEDTQQAQTAVDKVEDTVTETNEASQPVKIRLGKTKRAQEYTVYKDENGIFKVNNEDGTENTTRVNDVLYEYSKNTDLTQGNKVDSPVNAGRNYNPDTDIVEKSENPSEIAEVALRTKTDAYINDSLDYKTKFIADNIGKVNKKSYENFGDKNKIGRSMAKTYFAKVQDKGIELSDKGRAIDDIAQEMSKDSGVEITVEDIVSFMEEYPNGANDVFKSIKDIYSEPAKTRFTEITGLPATDRFLKEAVDQLVNKEKLIEEYGSLSILSDKDLISLNNEIETFNKENYGEDNNTRNESVNATENSQEDEGESTNTEDGREQDTTEDQAKDVNLSEVLGLDNALGFLENLEQKLNNETKDYLSMGIPIAVAKGALQAMKLATKGAKSFADVLSAGINHIKNTDWYKGLTTKEKAEAIDTFINYVNKEAKETKNSPKDRNTELSNTGTVYKKRSFKERARRFWNRNLDSDAGADKSIAETVRGRIRAVSQITDAIEYEAKRLKGVMKNAKKSKSKKVSKAEYNDRLSTINDYMSGDKDADVSFLTDEDVDTLNYLRDRIDALSEQLITLLEQADPDSDLIKTIKNNKGTYINRSYRAFSDSRYINDLTSSNPSNEAKRRIDAVVEYIMDNKKDLFGDNITEEEARAMVYEYLEGLKGSDNLITAKASGKADAPFFKKRQDIPKVFRELLGENKEPLINYVNTVYKTSNFIANIKYQNKLKDAISDLGLLSETAKEGYTKLAPSGDGWSTLNDYYVPNELKQSIDDLQPLSTISEDWVKILVGFSGFTKVGKTVFSPTTAFRNIASGILLSWNAGFDPIFKNPTKTLKALQQSWGTNKTHTEMKAERKKLIEYGVLNDGALSSDILETLNDLSKPINRIVNKNLAEKTVEAFQKFYSLGDDVYKVIGFYAFKEQFMKYGMSEADAEAQASERITNGFPTYTKLPKTIQKLRRFPFVGTFVSFPYEVIRTTKNNVAYTVKDFKEGRTKMGFQNLAGIIVASSASTALSALSMSLIGFDDEDDDAVRDMLPEYQTNSSLIYSGKDQYGQPEFIDSTAFFPAETIIKPLRTLFEERSSRSNSEKIFEGLEEIYKPFVGIDVSTEAILSLAKNKNDFGTEIYKSDNFFKALYSEPEKIAHYYLRQAGPGIYNNITEFARANDLATSYFGDKVTSYGKEYNNEDAGFAFFGIRKSTLNFGVATSQKARQYKEEYNGVRGDINSKLKSTKVLDDATIEDYYTNYKEKHNEIYDRVLTNIKTSRKLGMDEGKIKSALKLGGFSNADASTLLRGNMPKLKTISETTQTNQDKKIELNFNDKEKKKEVMKNYKKNIRNFDRMIRRTTRSGNSSSSSQDLMF